MIDLHLHLDGSLEPEDIVKLAQVGNVSLPADDPDTLRREITVDPQCTSLTEYLTKFQLTGMVMQTRESISLSVELLLHRLKQMGILYSEIRFAPQFHTQKGLTQEEVTEAAVEGLERGKIPAQLILCCMRGEFPKENNMETVRAAKKYLGKGVCCIDLAGDETHYPTKDYEEIFSYAHKLQVPCIIHAGESAGPESVKQALAFGAKRIGHGIRAIQDPELVQYLAQESIPLEMCFTSNIQTGTVSDVSQYPLIEYLNRGLLVTLNTDNMTVSGTTLKEEYKKVQALFRLDDETMKQIAKNAVKSSFLNEEEKETLYNKIEEQFFGWMQ